jgi:hypothetical protein
MSDPTGGDPTGGDFARSELARGQREELPTRRAHASIKFELDRVQCTGGIGYETHYRQTGQADFAADIGERVTEVWLNVGKVGSGIEALGHDAAILVSLLLQYGCPIDVIRAALTRNPDRTAAGPIGVLLDAIAGEGPQ